jgi:hypothetical protein
VGSRGGGGIRTLGRRYRRQRFSSPFRSGQKASRRAKLGGRGNVWGNEKWSLPMQPRGGVGDPRWLALTWVGHARCATERGGGAGSKSPWSRLGRGRTRSAAQSCAARRPLARAASRVIASRRCVHAPPWRRGDGLVREESRRVRRSTRLPLVRSGHLSSSQQRDPFAPNSIARGVATAIAARSFFATREPVY